MKFTKIALGLFCSMVLLCGCANKSNVVLKINDKEITRAEFYDDYNKIKDLQFKDAPKDTKNDNSYPVLALKERYLNDFIAKKLIEEEIAKKNIEASQDEIKARKDEIIKQIGGEDKFQKILKENNITEEKANDDFAKEIKIQKLIKALGVQDVTDAEAKKYYNSNIHEFRSPEQVQASHILFMTNPEALKRKIVEEDKDAKLSADDIDKKVKEEIANKEKLAKEVREKAAKNPKDFAKLAQQYSDDEASAKKGGDIGYIAREQVVPEFANAAFGLKVGQISSVVKSSFGLHIITVKDKTAAGTRPYDTVKEDLKRFLTDRKKMETMQKYIEDLKKNAKIEYIDETLNPDTLKKEIDKILQKQLEAQKKSDLPKSKLEVDNKDKK